MERNKKFSEMDNESVWAINTFIGTNIPVNEEEGVTNMCKTWDDQKRDGLLEGRKEGRREGRKEGTEQATLLAIRNMIKYGVPKNCILQDYSEEEYERAQNSQLVQG